ncbi:MAG TPA: hypothetical protein VN917_08565 [Xanthobacteraceae bacterium]|jgi:hypothetical protein|nr:hypothetical protein [Xanthobacteraceae bacterium]
MHRRPPIAAFAVTLVCFGLAAAFTGDAVAEEDPVCAGRAPFREVAQDEIYTFGELCSMREDFRRPDRERSGPGGVGWAKAPSIAPRRRN